MCLVLSPQVTVLVQVQVQVPCFHRKYTSGIKYLIADVRKQTF